QRVTIAAGAEPGFAEDTILVLPSPGPVLNVPGRQLSRPGDPVSFKVSVADASELPVTLAVELLPEGASFDAPTGVFQWIPRAGQIGKHKITFSAVNTARQSSS